MSTVDIGDDSADSLAGNAGATGGWSLRVKALLEGGAEREYRVQVQPSATVGDFRTKLSSKSQVAVHRLRLIFSGRVLANDSQRLADAGVGGWLCLAYGCAPRCHSRKQRCCQQPAARITWTGASSYRWAPGSRALGDRRHSHLLPCSGECAIRAGPAAAA
ncbi:hypothetical protein DL89DRAFT_94356 [Linderina pennispora]|uniref:Ubiquitin-like domain-containing protein n=1 Tax=Linderina pennispora TaxID=61395 RepID=A0A1Y1VQU8_9FUNG|nr:uncharacterized protein DL89DRAFT_94356 [Linderina pennispora]ORX63425.1 hypothetical protein DL89DRAFT_94356 [Linderina pennispora]